MRPVGYETNMTQKEDLRIMFSGLTNYFCIYNINIQTRCLKFLFTCFKKALSLMFSILLYGFV